MNQVEIDELVTVTDNEGNIYQYQVAECYTVEPNDNHIKSQGNQIELTLFTCAAKGTKRLVYKCYLRDGYEDQESVISDEM